jgi:hypothetical protein
MRLTQLKAESGKPKARRFALLALGFSLLALGFRR